MDNLNKNSGHNSQYNGDDRVKTSRHVLKSLKARADLKRTVPEKIADWMASAFGSVTFLVVNSIWFALWVVTNFGFIPGIPIFDPFPFGLLTMIVSLEAIILSVFVLISQNRATKVDDIREEIDLQLDIITEQEVTKTLALLVRVAEKNGIDLSEDKALQDMLRPVDVEKIENMLERQI